VDAVVAAQGPALTRLADLVAEHGVGLTRFAFLLCGDRGLAEDLVQDAYVGLYRRFGPDLPLAAPVAYARRAIVNGNVSRARRRAAGESPADDVPDVAVETAFPAEQDAMWLALGGLPHRQRTVLVLRYYLDLPDREIAELLGCPQGTVRSLATRAFAALRTHPAIAEEHRS
jgi:RNA polymerase sigma-70 factor (sigma-E family)